MMSSAEGTKGVHRSNGLESCPLSSNESKTSIFGEMGGLYGRWAVPFGLVSFVSDVTGEIEPGDSIASGDDPGRNDRSECLTDIACLY
jgi:hypothetical protein